MNPYYDPDKFGLTIIGTVEWEPNNYSFNYTCVWENADGDLYYADDAGCSCPAPFEDFDTLDKLTACTAMELAQHLQTQTVQSYYTEHATNSVAAFMGVFMNRKPVRGDDA